MTEEFITSNKIDFVAHDDIPYTGNGVDDIYGWLKTRGMFVATERTEGVSTSDIVARIVKDYDLYVRRNLARGYSAKELNVSFLSEKKFRFQNKMDELKSRGRRELTKVKGDIITKWEEKSREFIDAFLLLFGRDRLHYLWNESKGRLMQALSPPESPGNSTDALCETDEDDEDEDDQQDEEDEDDNENGSDDDDEEDDVEDANIEEIEEMVKNIDAASTSNLNNEKNISKRANLLKNNVDCHDEGIASELNCVPKINGTANPRDKRILKDTVVMETVLNI